MSSITSHFNQITSVSAQLASLQQVGLMDAWKRAIVPSELLLGLNDFAVKQYERIQKEKDDKSIAWRLGLIDSASKFVDAQITWGFALAVELARETLEVEIAVPDFSDFPIIFGHVKRDNKDVEEAFDESQLVEITGLGKLIIQKGRAVNDFCKARHQAVIFSESDLVNWAMTLLGTFCMDVENLNDVLDTLSKMFNRKSIIDLVG